ncbi:MAG TPA: MBL fold metallo-hydrolase [Pseudogracilibacillus sp.]|nr:MBL fold metallo-hydrolase [Pseudogracilibacillus sp.]
MKLTVLGYMGGYPSSTGATSTYLLEKDGYSILLDLGSGGLLTFQKYREVTDLQAVIVSHYHTDHIADIGVLQHALLVQSYFQEEQPILPIYGHTETLDAYESLTHKYTKSEPYIERETLNLGPFFIRFLKTNHPVPCYGMRITDGKQTVVYTADSAYQSSWIPFSRDADLFIADCNFYKGQAGNEAGHMTSQEVGYLASEANVKNVLLSHLPHYGNHQQLIEEAKAEYDGSVYLACEGFTWT